MTQPAERADYSACSLRPFRAAEDVCDRCGNRLSPGRRRWCSDRCLEADQRAHIWQMARRDALRRDGHRCRHCGSPKDLEVNHVAPRIGRGYLTGCWNHPDLLETLCRPCHVCVTRRQAEARRPVVLPFVSSEAPISAEDADLVDATMIASMLGLTRQRVQQLAHEPGFPAPVARLTKISVWVRPDIQRWAEQTGRLNPTSGSTSPPPPT